MTETYKQFLTRILQINFTPKAINKDLFLPDDHQMVLLDIQIMLSAYMTQKNLNIDDFINYLDISTKQNPALAFTKAYNEAKNKKEEIPQGFKDFAITKTFSKIFETYKTMTLIDVKSPSCTETTKLIVATIQGQIYKDLFATSRLIQGDENFIKQYLTKVGQKKGQKTREQVSNDFNKDPENFFPKSIQKRKDKYEAKIKWLMKTYKIKSRTTAEKLYTDNNMSNPKSSF